MNLLPGLRPNEQKGDTKPPPCGGALGVTPDAQDTSLPFSPCPAPVEVGVTCSTYPAGLMPALSPQPQACSMLIQLLPELRN